MRIIIGCGLNGRVNEALEILHEMIQSRVQPNEVTYLSVLSTCRHGGRVEKGWSIFQSRDQITGLNLIKNITFVWWIYLVNLGLQRRMLIWSLRCHFILTELFRALYLQLVLLIRTMDLSVA
ncbi:Pentatricopeptide repeat-containing protein At4g08210 [Linum perenne]